MKTYIGVKKLEAKPMTRGAYNEYRGWTIPENENPEDEGYLVKYPDGYESWSPKKQFEEAYREFDDTKLPYTALGMISDDYKERFKAEYSQLQIRYIGLLSMVDRWDKGTLPFTPTCPREIYNVQLDAMGKYALVLEERAKLEGIEL